MSIVQQLCPACAAPLPFQPNARRVKCAYCGSALSIEHHGDETSVELAGQVMGRLEQRGAHTQTELQIAFILSSACCGSSLSWAAAGDAGAESLWLVHVSFIYAATGNSAPRTSQKSISDYEA